MLSGCLNSEVSRQLSAGDEAKARETAGWYQEVFGKDFYFMEIQSHGIEEQTRVTEGTVRLARELGAPLCGTNDSHYVDASHAKAHEALLCIQTGAAMSDPGRWRFSTEEFYLKSADEMRSVFKDLPEAYRNTLAVAERCDLALGFGQFHLPKYDVPAGYTLDSNGKRLDKEGKPINLRLDYPNTDDNYPKVAQFVTSWYAQLGIGVTSQGFDSATLGEIILPPEGDGKAKYDIELWGWVGNPDPNALLQIFRCDAIGSSSDSQYCNPAFDNLYDQQLKEAGTARHDTLAKMQNLIYNDAPYDILYYEASLDVWRNDRFASWQSMPSDGTPLFTYGILDYTLLTDAGRDCAGHRRRLGRADIGAVDRRHLGQQWQHRAAHRARHRRDRRDRGLVVLAPAECAQGRVGVGLRSSRETFEANERV